MKERPILFSAPMVRAILDGRKSQTRRVIKPQPDAPSDARWVLRDGLWHPCVDTLCRGVLDPIGPGIRCPYGAPGDRLWVKHAADVFDVYYKPITGWEDRYAAGTDGRIYRIDRREPKPLAGSPSSKGYLTVSLSRGAWETHAVHKLVCETFYGPAPFDGAQVRHLDGDRTNNRPENLDWGTAEQNWQDRKAHGRGMGAEHHAAKLSPEQVAEIRASSLSQRALAEKYGVSQSTIHDARRGKTWSEHEPASRTAPGFSLWRSPLFCPRWASRITLEITGVRVERLHDITESDARAEGVDPVVTLGKLYPSKYAADVERESYREGFRRLWCEINGAESWERNDWVWVIEFRRVEAQDAITRGNR